MIQNFNMIGKLSSILLGILLGSFMITTVCIAQTDQWVEVNTAVTPPARFGHTMVKMGTELYVFGGVNNVELGKKISVQRNIVREYESIMNNNDIKAPVFLGDLWTWDE